MTGDRYWPTREVRAFDLASGKEWAAFSYGGVDDYPLSEELAPGALVVFATENRVAIRAFDSPTIRVLYEAPKDTRIGGLAVSHSGTLLAITTQPSDSFSYAKSDLVVIGLSTGTSGPSPAPPVRTFSRGGAAFDGFSGWIAFPAWLANDAGFLVVGAAARDGPGGRATLFMDGRVVVLRAGWRVLSPDGRLSFDSPSTACYGLDGPELFVRDSVTERLIASARREGEGVQAVQWSPDSSAVLYFSFVSREDACSSTPALRWWLLTVATGVSTEVSDLNTARLGWYGKARYELTCPDDPTPPRIGPMDGGYLGCQELGKKGHLVIAGVNAGDAAVVFPIGVWKP